MEAAAPTFSPLRDTPTEDLTTSLRRGRRRLMIAGVIALVIGAGAIIVPNVASVATAIFVGWILVLSSGYLLADAFSVRHTGRRILRALLALLTFAAGLYLLVAPLDGTFTLTSSAAWAIGLIVGIDLIFSGSLLIALAMRLRALEPDAQPGDA